MTSPTAARIAEAARRILVTEGSAAVTMRRVAGDVGVTPMAIYRHYANREELLRTIADTTLDELATAWRAHSAAADPGDRLAAAVDWHLDFALGRPNLYFFLCTELRHGSNRSPTLATLTGLIAAEHGDRLALMVTAELHGLIELRHSGGIDLPDADFRAFCQDAVERIVDGPSD